MLTSRLLADCSLDQAVAGFNAGYREYLVPVALDRGGFEARFRAEGVSGLASYLWFDGDAPVAIMLIARRGALARLAALGIAPEYRGGGFGRRAMQIAEGDARRRGDRAVLLEVIAGNAGAERLYSGRGFRETGRLHGFSLALGSTSGPAAALRASEPHEAARLAGRFGATDLPWQQEPATLAGRVAPMGCLVDSEGRAVLGFETDPLQRRVRLTSLAIAADLAPAEAKAITRGFALHFAGHAIGAPALFPDSHRLGFFEPGGWRIEPMAQILMRLDLG